jgi:hypothetical protein
LLYSAQAKQEGDANRELWFWIRICGMALARFFFAKQT